jgi:hypothetical protein
LLRASTTRRSASSYGFSSSSPTSVVNFVGL